MAKTTKLSRLKNEVLNLRLSLHVMNEAVAEPYCNLYEKSITAPLVEFLFIRKTKRSRYPKYDPVIKKYGGVSTLTIKTEKVFKNEFKYYNLWCAN